MQPLAKLLSSPPPNEAGKTGLGSLNPRQRFCAKLVPARHGQRSTAGTHSPCKQVADCNSATDLLDVLALLMALMASALRGGRMWCLHGARSRALLACRPLCAAAAAPEAPRLSQRELQQRRKQAADPWPGLGPWRAARVDERVVWGDRVAAEPSEPEAESAALGASLAACARQVLLTAGKCAPPLALRPFPEFFARKQHAGQGVMRLSLLLQTLGRRHG